MIKFFRNIRKKLLSEGKTSRYLTYAVGEIILVVIGILIALQINNWNETRKHRNRSIDYHQRLKEDLVRAIEDTERIHKIAAQTLESITTTVTLLEQGRLETKADSAAVNFALIWFSRTNYKMAELPTYEEMKSNGDLNLIYDVALRDDMASFTNFLDQVETVVIKISNAVENDFSVYNKYLRTYVDSNSLEVTYDFDFQSMAQDPEFINTFSRLAYHWRGYVFFMKGIIRDAEKIKGRVEGYLNEIGK